MYSKYYQAIVNVPYTWFITGVLRNEDHLVLERTLAGHEGKVLEFFVPESSEKKFVDLMRYFVDKDYVFSFEEKPNRLAFTEENSNLG